RSLPAEGRNGTCRCPTTARLITGQCHLHEHSAMKPAQFEYARPETVDDAVKLLSSHGGEAKVIAGGQSLRPMLAFRLAAPKLLVDIGRLDLKRIAISSG